MAEPGPSGGRPISLPQVIVILVGVAVTLLALLFVFGITIGAVSGFPTTATLLPPALIFLALSALLLVSGLGLRRFGPPSWWVATIVSGVMFVNVVVVMALTGEAPFGLLLSALVAGGAVVFLLVSRPGVPKEGGV